MKSKEKLWKICMDIYREMYRKAEPTANFDKLIGEGETKEHNWFMSYYLPEDTQQKIIEKYCKENNLSKYEKEKVSATINLGCAPRSVK